jgi:two-component system response regulator PilR (NtrC family)
MGKVLVVEDEPSSRRALIALLELNGMETLSASSLCAALDQLKHKPDWILLDLMLPDGTGTAIVDHIRTRKLPIRIGVTTGAGNWQALLEKSPHRPDEVFLKPLDFDRIVAWLAA